MKRKNCLLNVVRMEITIDDNVRHRPSIHTCAATAAPSQIINFPIENKPKRKQNQNQKSKKHNYPQSKNNGTKYWTIKPQTKNS